MLRLVQVSATSPPSPSTGVIEDLEEQLQDMARKLTTARIFRPLALAYTLQIER